jgi:hypothetical protein
MNDRDYPYDYGEVTNIEEMIKLEKERNQDLNHQFDEIRDE